MATNQSLNSIPGMGSSNSAFGQNALQCSINGNHNSAFGYTALQCNNGSFNSAFGRSALQCNTTGGDNSAFGMNALQCNTTGCFNSAFGYTALQCNTNGGLNSAFGMNALYCNTTGCSNSAFGYTALFNNTTGCFNSAFGMNAGCACSNASNVIMIGADSGYTAANGKASTIVGSVAWTTYSDINFKHEIQIVTEGMELIRNLEPISYYWQPKKERLCTEKKSIGFGAQCVEYVFENCISSPVIKELKENVVVHTGDGGVLNATQWGVTLANLIPFMVNAIKELDSRLTRIEEKLS